MVAKKLCLGTNPNHEQYNLAGCPPILYIGAMVTVNVIEIEVTSFGELADVVIEKSIAPQTGMMLMNDDSETWEVTAALHNSKRVLNEDHTKLWTLQCKAITASKAMQPGLFKLIH